MWFFLALLPLVLGNLAYAITRHFWCTQHWKRNAYRSIVSYDGREHRWCELCRAESPYGVSAWEKLK